MILIKLFHRRCVFNAGEVDRIRQERGVRCFVALQRIEQERRGKVINQIQHPCLVPDWIEAEKSIGGVFNDPGFVLTRGAKDQMLATSVFYSWDVRHPAANITH